MTRRKFHNFLNESAAIQQTTRQIHGVEMTPSSPGVSRPNNSAFKSKYFCESFFSMNGREFMRKTAQALTFDMMANCNIIKKLLPIFILMNMLPLFYAGE